MSKPVKSEIVDETVIATNEEDDDLKSSKMLVGKTTTTSSKIAVRCCQADKCGTDLAVAKQYHRRHKVCEVHAKAQVVLVAGVRQRFCQQCSRFHEVVEFDNTKRSCRRRLAGHNERRRKSPATSASNSQGQDISSNQNAGMACGCLDDSGRFYSTHPEKHFQIR